MLYTYTPVSYTHLDVYKRQTVGIPADTTNTEWPAMVECAKPVIEQSTNRFTWACGVESNVDMTPVIKENFIKLMAGSITADEFVSTMQDLSLIHI